MKPVSGKRLCRLLEPRGWVLVRVNGSHFVYRDPAAGGRAVVPVHGNNELKPRTQKNIMRDAGLTDDDL